MERVLHSHLGTLLPSTPVRRSSVALLPPSRPSMPKFLALSNSAVTLLAFTGSVCLSSYLSKFLLTFFSFPACTTTLSISFSFGGKSWPINAEDINVGRISTGSDICAGGIFDLTAGSNIGSGGGNPTWVVGATFLKNVYSVFRYQPAGIGFAELSNAAGGSSGECYNWACSSHREMCAL